jgi:hypothetical protein
MMADNDVFISYAHIDNMPLKEGESGWVDEFHYVLKVRLAQLLGEEPKIWRDQKLKGNDFFDDEIVAQFPGVTSLISIISPRYIKSEWCKKELKTFFDSAAHGIGIRIGNKSRVIKLIKTPVPYKDHPPEIVNVLGYEFYIIDSKTGKVRELHQKFNDELAIKYRERVDDVANDIRYLLERVKQNGSQQQEEQLKIYLAETCEELKESRNMIKRELMGAGFGILPDYWLPHTESKFRKSVEHLLDQSVLSIHLVGGSYGPVPEGSRESITVLQNEIAAQKCKKGKLQRLIWLPSDTGIDETDERQKQFIHQVRTDAETQYGADMFETPMINFNYALHDKLESIKSPRTARKDRSNESRYSPTTISKNDREEKVANESEGIKTQQIYLMCDQRDLDHTAELEDFLYHSEFDVILPAFEGDETELMEDHRENLKSCDAVILYYGQGNELWMRSKIRDLTKIAGYGRTRPLDVKAVFLAPPVTRQKERFRLHEWEIINGIDSFSPALMESFTEILKSQGK